MRGDYGLIEQFPDRGGKRLKPRQAIALIKRLKPGYLCSGWVESRGGKWLLRLRLDYPEGGCVQPSLTLPDEVVAQWAIQAVAKYREDWKKYQHERRSRSPRSRYAKHMRKLRYRDRRVRVRDV